MNENSSIPDFSGDDFANDKTIRQYREAIREYQEMVEQALNLLSTELELEAGSHRNLKGFTMFRHLEPIVRKSISSESFHISLVEYHSAIPMPKIRNEGTDEYLFGMMELRQSYPKTYICRETIREKIAELIYRNEIDFPHSKTFSRRFYVLTEDKKRLADILQFCELDQLTLFPNMEIELDGNKCLFRNSRKPVSLDEAKEMTALAKLLFKLL
jgi:hypothetical protein